MANQEEVRDVYGYFEQKGNALCYRYEAERVRIEPWGADSLRVRAWKTAEMDQADWALIKPEKEITPEIEVREDGATIRNGKIRAEINLIGKIAFYNQKGELLLDEYVRNRKDKELQQACRNLWDNMVHKRMYITGSVGSSGFLERFTTDYDLPNDSNYSETCATIALAMFGKRMADMEKDASYMDVVERALYNTLLSGIAMDGKSFFYVNPLEVWPVSCMPRTSREHVKPVRQKWFGVACCPPNITRTLASLGQYIYFQEENEIYVNLYVANETEVTLNGVPFKITLKGNFPWENKMTVSVDGVQETEAMIAFRVPAYAENFKILRNGKEENLTEDHGYIKISGKMYKETFEISFDAEPVFVHANPQVRVDSAKVAVVKGPLVYCVEEADNGENLSSVMVNTDQKIEETYDDELLEGCSVLHITGKKISEKGWNEGILYQNRKVELEDVKLTLVPYCYWGNRENGEMLVWMKELFYM